MQKSCPNSFWSGLGEETVEATASPAQEECGARTEGFSPNTGKEKGAAPLNFGVGEKTIAAV